MQLDSIRIEINRYWDKISLLSSVSASQDSRGMPPGNQLYAWSNWIVILHKHSIWTITLMATVLQSDSSLPHSSPVSHLSTVSVVSYWIAQHVKSCLYSY